MRKRAGEVGSQRPLRANASQHTDCDVVFGGRGRGVVVAPVDGPTHGHNWYHSSTAHGMVHAGESNTTQVPRWPSKHLTPHPSVCVCVRGGGHILRGSARAQGNERLRRSTRTLRYRVRIVYKWGLKAKQASHTPVSPPHTLLVLSPTTTLPLSLPRSHHDVPASAAVLCQRTLSIGDDGGAPLGQQFGEVGGGGNGKNGDPAGRSLRRET
jgi:hypothetical protein